MNDDHGVEDVDVDDVEVVNGGDSDYDDRRDH